MNLAPRWNVPSFWKWVAVDEIADVTGGGTPSAKDPENFQDKGGVAWITPADLTGYKAEFIDRGKRNLSEKGFSSSSTKLLPEGAVLFTSRAPIGYCAIAANPICTNQGFKSLTLYGGVSGRFVRHYLKWSKPFLETLASGTTFLELSGAKLKQAPLPLPPLAEQKRIVGKLDALSAKSDRARTHLARIESLTKRYKQAVLSKAFSGELTKDWRKGKGYNPGVKVELEEKPKAKGKKISPPTEEHKKLLWSIPSNWVWGQVGKCSFVTKLAGFEYTKHVEYHPEGDLRVIKAENAGPNGFRLTDFSKVKSGSVAMLERSRLFGGELLVVFVGAGTGQVALVPQCSDFFLGPNIGMVRPEADKASAAYLELFFRFEGGRQLLLSASKAVAQPSLSMGAIRSTPLALPPLCEQTEIVRRIEATFAKLDKLAADAKRALALTARLDEAILAKAFRGELVPQDPNDEPASVLLDRIKADRANAPKPKRGRGNKA